MRQLFDYVTAAPGTARRPGDGHRTCWAGCAPTAPVRPGSARCCARAGEHGRSGRLGSRRRPVAERNSSSSAATRRACRRRRRPAPAARPTNCRSWPSSGGTSRRTRRAASRTGSAGWSSDRDELVGRTPEAFREAGDRRPDPARGRRDRPGPARGGRARPRRRRATVREGFDQLVYAAGAVPVTPHWAQRRRRRRLRRADPRRRRRDPRLAGPSTRSPAGRW